ncbi:hypothetical protein AUP68_03059 [Ilyonectria robusta]
MAPPTAFADYPEPNEGPDTKYNPKIDQNPVLRGLPLVIGANLVGFLQQHFWDNARFGTIKDIPELDGIPYRFHVWPYPILPNSDIEMSAMKLMLTSAAHRDASRPHVTHA